jgi:hypothetical protein
MARNVAEPAESAGSSLFPAVHGVSNSAIERTIAALYAEGSEPSHSVDFALKRFGHAALRYAHERGIRLVLLARDQRYHDVSPALVRLGIDVDAWPAPPAGLFVVEERTVYLRSRSSMTAAHEFAHALDCALGNGTYRSGCDPELRRLFSEATRFVTPYQACGLDEFFAEAVRAFVDCNDPSSPWPKATPARLQALQPEVYAHVERILTVEIPQQLGIAQTTLKPT